MSSNRENLTMRLMYVIGIILVTASHCNYGGIYLFYEWFPPYAYHLALFIFVSGYFYHSENDLLQTLWKKIKKLILPVYFWNIVYGLFTAGLMMLGFVIGYKISLYNLIISPITNGHQFLFNLGGWFVIPLFVVQTLNYTIRHFLDIEDKTEVLAFIVSSLLGCVGVLLASKGMNEGWWLFLTRILYFIPFYEGGIIYRKLIEPRLNISSFLYFSIIFLIDIVILLVYKKIPYLVPSWMKPVEFFALHPFVIGFLGIAFWLRVCKLLSEPIGKSKIIFTIADSTFDIMMHQFLGFYLLKSIYALISIYTPLFNDFDMNSFKTDFWYYYVPYGIDQLHILYVAFGIFVPIGIKILIERIKNIICRKSKEKEAVDLENSQ